MAKLFHRITRDTILFALGAAGFLHEVLGTGLERPTLLLICAGMMGLPVFLRADERKKDDG